MAVLIWAAPPILKGGFDMTRDEVAQVKAIALEIAKEEIAKALAELAPVKVAKPASITIGNPVKKSTK